MSRYFRDALSIVALDRRPSPNSSSYALEELDVQLEGGTTLQLIFKDLHRSALSEDGRRAKPHLMYDPLREIEVYQDILSRTPLTTASCYGAVVDTDVQRYWLFLEKVEGPDLRDIGEFSTWQETARWIAGLHSRFADDPQLTARPGHLIRYDRDFYRLWLRRAQANSGRYTRRRPSAVAGFEALLVQYDRVIERLAALPATLLHGEFYAPNILVQARRGTLRVCPVDWEMAAWGPGLIDLAALIAGKWSEEQKLALALSYHSALTPSRDSPPPRDEFLAALDLCRLHVAVQWIGWSSEWSPPRRQAYDWFGEALRLGQSLKL